MVTRQQISLHAGPLPSPEVMERYNTLVEDGAERIFVQFEEQGRHRRALELESLRAEIKNQARGQWLGFLISLVALVLAFELIRRGHEVWGFALVIADLATLVGVYVWGKRETRREREEKSRLMQEGG